MKILVTGSDGQLGNEFRSLSDKSEFKFIFTNRKQLDLVDFNKLSDLISTIKPDIIINCAAYTAVDLAEKEIQKAESINTNLPESLSILAKKNNSILINISTDYVFDGKTYKPYKETDIVNPQSAYGTSKQKGDEYVLKYNKGIIIRTSWLYSSYGNNFVKNMIRLGNERDELSVVYDQIGTPTYASDLANAIHEMIIYWNKDISSFTPGIYHYSNEGVCSWYDFAVAIFSLYEINCRVIPIDTKDYPLPATRPCFSILDKSKIKNNFNIKIPHWRKSLLKCINKIKSEKHEQ